MKVFRIAFIIAVVIGLFQCKKDKEIPPFERFLENGKYVLNTDNNYKIYLITDNILYSQYIRTGEFCLEKPAGKITSLGDSIFIKDLKFHGNGSVNTCNFMSEIFGGDTAIYHFSGISVFYDNNQKKGLKGEYYCNVSSGNPFPKLEGFFILSYSPNQN